MDNWGPLGWSIFLALSPGSSALPQPLLLGLLGLWPVLVHQLEQLGSGLSVQGAVELVDCWGHPQPSLEDDLLPLETDVLRPLDEERVDNPLSLGLLDSQGGGCHLLPLLTFLL